MKAFNRTWRTTRWMVGALVLVTVAATTAAGTGPGEQRSLRDWEVEVAQTPLREQGCFTADYPEVSPSPAECVEAPHFPQTPRHGPTPQVIGDKNDVVAVVPNGEHISTSIGSFDAVTNVTSESGPIGNAGPSIANAYTLQLNTNYFASTACAASPNPGCKGWAQFVFANNGSSGQVFIQYWLLQYNAACPGGWNQFSFNGGADVYCYKNNSAGATPVPNQPITNLADLRLSGEVSANSDKATLFVGAKAYSVTGDNAVNAAAGWTASEFNVFGYGGNSDGGGTATFNDGASLTVRTTTIYGGTEAPTCMVDGFTGEKNSLSFGSPAPTPSNQGPGMKFVQDTVGGAMANCAAATTFGDVHTRTVGGLAYDFQAVGDFVLAQVGPDFEVQARQVSGAPTWPDTSVNQAIGVRVGGTGVAVCGGPRLVVDGRAVDLAEGGTLSTPTGVDITLAGGVYFVTDQDGNSVRVTPRTGRLDVSVGVGTWPTTVRGLLGNPDHDVSLLGARDGTVFQVPLSFDDLYRRFGDSWRVSPTSSLLSPCGARAEERNPAKPFTADDLDPALRERAHATCVQAGVPTPWLKACALDVAVLGAQGADAFVGMAPPVLVG